MVKLFNWNSSFQRPTCYLQGSQTLWKCLWATCTRAASPLLSLWPLKTSLKSFNWRPLFWRSRSRRSSERSSNRRRTWIRIIGKSCCGITTSSNKRTWRANWAKARGTASLSTTMMLHRKTKVGAEFGPGAVWIWQSWKAQGSQVNSYKLILGSPGYENESSFTWTSEWFLAWK